MRATPPRPLNPEPYAYESGFAAKWVIEAQIDQMRGGPPDPRAGDLDYATGPGTWIAWAAYLWADGPNPRSDGLTWQPGDLAADGTHPSASGRAKVGTLLHGFLQAVRPDAVLVPRGRRLHSGVARGTVTLGP